MDEFSSFMAMINSSNEPEAPVEPEAPDVEEDAGEEEDHSMDFLKQFASEEEADVEEEEDYEEEDESEDEEEESDEESEEESDDEYEEEEEELQEAVDVDFDTVITLPNGTELTIEELTKGYKSGTELESHVAELASEREQLEADRALATKRIELSKLEAEKVIEEFRGFDWQKLASENPEQFANTKLFVEKYIERKAEIEEEYKNVLREKEESAAAELKANAKICVEKLNEDIPGWNQNLYNDILRHGVEELGVDQAFLEKCTDPGVLKAIYSSLRLKKGAETVKAKVTKKVKAPTKTVKATKKEVKVTKPKSSAKTYNPSDETSEFSFFSSMMSK